MHLVRWLQIIRRRRRRRARHVFYELSGIAEHTSVCRDPPRCGAINDFSRRFGYFLADGYSADGDIGNNRQVGHDAL